MADSSAQIFSTNFQRKFSAQIFSQIFSAALNANADSQCTNFNSNNLRVVSPLVYNIYSVRRSKWNLKKKKLFKLLFLSNLKCQLMGIPVRADRMQFAVEQTVGP